MLDAIVNLEMASLSHATYPVLWVVLVSWGIFGIIFILYLEDIFIHKYPENLGLRNYLKALSFPDTFCQTLACQDVASNRSCPTKQSTCT